MNNPIRQKRAAALRYDGRKDSSPKVTANGKGYIAENIINKAKKNNVPIQQDPTLVALLSELNINENIPEDLYLAVAEVFSFIYQADKQITEK